MADPAARLREDRLNRAAARANFDGALVQVMADLAARGVGGRVAATLGNEARDVLVHGIEVADENRGVVGGTALALVLWFARGPIIDNLERLLGND